MPRRAPHLGTEPPASSPCALHRSRRRPCSRWFRMDRFRSEEHTSELQSLRHLVCRLLLEKKQPACTRTRPSFFSRRPAIVTAGGDNLSQGASVAEMAVFLSFFFFKIAGTPPSFPSSPPRPFSY